jgi:hypothetical protein
VFKSLYDNQIESNSELERTKHLTYRISIPIEITIDTSSAPIPLPSTDFSTFILIKINIEGKLKKESARKIPFTSQSIDSSHFFVSGRRSKVIGFNSKK